MSLGPAFQVPVPVLVRLPLPPPTTLLTVPAPAPVSVNVVLLRTSVPGFVRLSVLPASAPMDSG